MNTQDFLRAVLPSAGHGLYCAMSGKTKKHIFVEQVEHLIPQFEKWVKAGHDAYFALATYQTDENRTKANARYLRAFFLDLDGYESPKVAWTTLATFLKENGLWDLGKPVAVVSGGGLHAYWPLTRDIEVAEWEPIARNFKRLCVQEKLKIDMTVTADAARILRPPGTYNFKPKYEEPLPVQVVRSGDTFDPVKFGEAIAALLIEQEPLPSNVIPLNIGGSRPTHVASNVTMFKNTTSLFKNLWDKTEAGVGCQQLQYYKDHATESGMEPLWRGLLSLARHCDDGTEYATVLSDLHPFPEQEVRSKWAALADQKPHLCATFASVNPGGCDGCPHRRNPRFRTPMNLTRETTTTDTLPDMEIEVAVSSDVELPRATRERPECPEPFSYGEHGGMFVTLTTDDKDGKKKIKRSYDHAFMDYYIYPIEVLHDNTGNHSVRFRAEHPKGDKVFMLSGKDITTQRETVQMLGSQNVWPRTRDDDEHLHRYLRACTAAVSTNRDAVNMPTQLGWQEDGSFVFAGKKFTKGEKPIDVPVPDGLMNVTQATKPKGTLKGFKRVIDMMTARRMYPQLAGVLLGAGSVFMRFTGLHGLVVHCASKNSGTGKSVTLDVASAIWGDPLIYKVSKDTSKVAAQNRVGLLNSLPLTMDEVTIKTRGPNGDWFPDFLLSFTEGKGKDRLTQTAVERSNTTTWSSIALLSSNTQIADMLLTREHAAEGEIRRLLEIHMDERVNFNEAETEILQSMVDNHGVLGYQMAQWLVDQDEDELTEKVRGMVAQVAKDLKADGSERFWMAGIGCAVVTAVFWKDMGFARLPMKEIWGVFESTVRRLRDKMDSNVRTSEDVLQAYIEQYGSGLVFINKGELGKMVLSFGGGVDMRNTNTVTGRCELLPTGEKLLVITVKRMTAHCAAMSFSIEQFRDDVIAAGITLDITKKSITSHTKMPSFYVDCYVMRIPRGRYDELQPGEDAVGAG